MKSNKTCSRVSAWLGLLAMFSTGAAIAAPIVQFSPLAVAAATGGTASTDVIATNLSSEFIGAFDLTVVWDPMILSLTDVTFDSFLDGPVLSFSGWDASSAGSASIFETSLGPLSVQTGSDPFRLFTLTFTALAAGTSDLGFLTSQGLLGNEFGAPYAEFGLGTGRVTVTRGTAVPEPGTWTLLLVGLIGISLLGRVRRSAK